MKHLKLFLLSASLVCSLSSQTIFAADLSSDLGTIERNSASLHFIEVSFPFELRDSETGEVKRILSKKVPVERLRARKRWTGWLIPHRETKFVHVKEYANVQFDDMAVRLIFADGTELKGAEKELIQISLEGTDSNPKAKVEIVGDHRGEYEISQYYDHKNTIIVYVKLKAKS